MIAWMASPTSATIQVWRQSDTAKAAVEEELAAAVHKTDALKIAMDASKATDEELVKAYGDIPADLAREKMMEDAASLALKQSGAQKPSVMTAKINARRGLTGGKRRCQTGSAATGAASSALRPAARELV